MSGWLVAHNAEIGLFFLGFLAGVWFAAWRQVRLEDARWERELRSFMTDCPYCAPDERCALHV